MERRSDHITPRKEHVGRFNAHVQHSQGQWRAAQAIVMVASANDVGCERSRTFLVAPETLTFANVCNGCSVLAFFTIKNVLLDGIEF